MSETLTHRTVKNSIYSLIGFIWPLALSFIASPIIIRSLGSARFGFYSLLNTVLVVFSLLDFGINYTFTKQLSEKREDPSGRELSETFSTTTILYAVIGIVAIFSLLLFEGLFRSLFKIPEGFVSSFRVAFFILGASFMLKMLTVTLGQIPYALQRNDIGTNIALVSSTLLQIGSIAALKTGHGILSLLLIQLIVSGLIFILQFWAWKKLAPHLHFKFVLSKKIIKTIGQQGFWLLLSNNMGNILAQFDKFVLGAIWGPPAVGYYTTAQMVPEKISGVSFSLSHIFFPIFSEVSSNEENKQLRVKNIFRRSIGLMPIITSGLTIVVLLYGYQLIHFWINEDFATHTAIAVPLLAFTYFFLSFGNFFHAFLSGLQELKFLAFTYLIVAAIDVVFMFLLIPNYSLNGASLAYLLSALPMLPLLYYIERRYFESKRREIISFYGKIFAEILIVGTIVFVGGWVFLRPLINNLVLVMVVGGFTFMIYLSLFWLFGFYTPEDRSLIKFYAGRILAVFKIKI